MSRDKPKFPTPPNMKLNLSASGRSPPRSPPMSSTGLQLPPPPPPASSVRTSNLTPATTAAHGSTLDSTSFLEPPAHHQSTAPTHVLQSAPPSGNFDWVSSSATSALDVLGSASASAMGTALMSLTSSTISSLSLPPPPVPSNPPPPPPTSSTYATSSSQSQRSPKVFSQHQPTIAPLPPPPPPPVVMHQRVTPFAPPRPHTQTQTPHPAAAPVGAVSQEPAKAEGQEPIIQDENEEDPSTAAPPPRLPITTFMSKNPSVPLILAKRQTHLPILVLATESSHALAWKNKLRLVDLLEGLSIQQQSQSSSQSNAGGSGTMTMTTHPFRSVSRQMQVHLGDLNVRFLEPEQLYAPLDDEQAQQVLYQHALLREEDGNLQHELIVLEDQVDNLLDEQANRDHYSTNNTNTNYDSQERAHRLEQVVKDAFALTSPLHIPWLWRYRVAADDATDGLPWDLTCAPVLVVCVCTTADDEQSAMGGGGGGLLETLKTLVHSPYALPRPYHTGLLDPSAVRKEVLVLHDNVDGPRSDTWNEASLRQTLLQQFGSNASIVRCNSIPKETARLLAQEETTDLWGGGGTLGNCLSVSDRVSLRKYLTSLLTSALLPAMERRVADLNVIVSEKKKGVKNVFKSLWGGGRSSAGTNSGGGSSHGGNAGGGMARKMESTTDDQPVLYRYDTIESQTRLLADSLFLMKDYDASLSMYRLIRDDYKQDKAHAHYASAQEMMALCMYLTDPYGRSRDVFSYVENALLSYSRAAEDERPPAWGEKPGRPTSSPRSTRLATRLCLVLISTKNILSDRHLEVADLLASASSHETSLGAAVLLEQSSSHYFTAEMYRKYAFHMLMSGHMFRSAEQEHHAFRCFTSALYIYRESKWEELHNHIRSALAAQLYSMNRMAVALQLYAKLVGSTEGGRVSAKSQQKFVNHLLEICNEHPKKALVGADRMAASSKLSGELRDSVRKERLDRIVQVVRFTKSASRVLELPNVDLPGVDDSTVAVLADEASHHESWIPSFGDVQRGSDDVWDELQLMATAELAIYDGRSKPKEEEISSAPLAKIEDTEIRTVFAQIDREKTNRNMQERAKRRDSHKADFPVRAQQEPLAVEFAISNPLAIPIDLVDMQIVARMIEEDTEATCTNEDAIKITPLVTYDKKGQWTFLGSTVSFEVPDFCRVSSGGPDSHKQAWKSTEEVKPFFVVTKTNITLEPESRRTVSASICPLTKGNLEVVGVRCRLLDDVWVLHSFDLKGPLLQNTRSNRANRVRAEPTLLKAKVERGMPCLKSELVRASAGTDENSPLLQGQVGSWLLRLSNVGTAAAQNIYLKTNLPWIYIDTEERDSSATCDRSLEKGRNCCVGLTGTLFELPVRGTSLRNEGVIEPGEVVDIPIRIRATGAGRQDFYMLFRYELMEDASASSPRYRWLRKMVEVPVYPSISLSVTITPSFASQTDHILSIEVTNNRTDRPDKLELVLEKLCLASHCYRLEPLPGQFAGLNRAKLGWQERATVHYRVVAPEKPSGGLVLSECNFSSSDANTTVRDAVSSSILHYPCLERAYDAFENALRTHQMALRAAATQGQEQNHPRSIAQIRRANTGTLSNTSVSEQQDNSHATSIARLCPADRSDETLCLALCWRDEANKVFGEHFVRDLEIRPLSKTNGCPITVTAQHPQTLSVDFNAGPARIPVNVRLRNRLVKDPVEFEFSVESSDNFDFIGPGCFKSALSGGEELSVPLQALIPRPGVYNLQKIRLMVDDEEASFPMQWLVSVSEA